MPPVQFQQINTNGSTATSTKAAQLAALDDEYEELLEKKRNRNALPVPTLLYLLSPFLFAILFKTCVLKFFANFVSSYWTLLGVDEAIEDLKATSLGLEPA